MTKTNRKTNRRNAATRKATQDSSETALIADNEIGIDEVALEDVVEETVDADDEYHVAQTGRDDQIEDPVRIYLMQMGEIPLLTRAEEIAAAKRIERARRLFRHSMLATDYVLHGAMGLLQHIGDGKLRLDRTIEVSVINVREKRRLLKLLGPNLNTLSI